MRDIFDFESPLGWLGRLVDRMILGDYLRRFLEQRALAIKAAAEEAVSKADRRKPTANG